MIRRGDYVIISEKYYPQIVSDMYQYFGKFAKVERVMSDSCFLDVDNCSWYWPVECLKRVVRFQ